MDPLTGELLAEKQNLYLFPATHFVTPKEKLELAIEDIKVELEEQLEFLRSNGKVLEAARLESRPTTTLRCSKRRGLLRG